MTIETTSTNTNSQQMRFPWKLHMLLERTDAASVISWMPDGKSFLIHDKDRFSQELLPEFFGTTNFKTFQRNLNLWGFTRISKGPNKDQTSHPLFLRGFPGLSRNMKRIVLKGTGRGNRAPRGGISDLDVIKQRALISDVSSVSSTSSTLTGTGQPSASHEKSNGAAAAALASYTMARDNKTTNNAMPNIVPSGTTGSCGNERLGIDANTSTPGPASATFKSLAPLDKQVLDASSIQQLVSLIQTLRNGEITAPAVATPTTTTTSFSSPLLSALYAAQEATKLLPSQLSLLSSSAPLAASTNDISCNKFLLQALLQQQQQQNRQQQLQEAQQQQQLVLQQAVLKQALERQRMQQHERQERIASALKIELLLNRILLSQGGGMILGQQQP
ncbi:HSF-type DNA-binding protein [Nitzschia inconspicua]|uniref:HSF-type DNA-binding protein n=1 Tax=Nitzschia inconspicua TaxID=303405 RepID=A0A9K3LMW3_9STRA|nr:HSF-type DNA-binding protein [Nitzschia inconspicua]